jgi:hypothetical protein
MNSDTIKLELTLTPVEQVLADECMENYETIFGKKISLEQLFKISIFHSLQINKCKKIILDSYDIGEAINNTDKGLGESPTPTNKTNKKPKKTAKGKIKSYSSPKGSNPELIKKNKQATFGGFV